ncbi:hypothetical protein CMUS01_14018 [Colletotrichum musicola]|uniref:Uncharacterized protein n=1 Tax=Colletotrichum musicola TaxID=2175873 RepID=A0A8H6MTN0_9PEZI|nr:hypothetical protein CMUS01_14018 [Colletotrichum musicola]
MADGRTLKGYVDAQKGYINPDGQTRLQKIIDLLETPVAALHPAVAGTAVFRMLYNTQSLTVNVENASWRLISAAHLYNWFRVLDNGFPRWPDMEKMIDLQQVEIFAASERPKTGEKCCKRFWMARGLKLEDIHEHSTTDTLEEAASKRSVPLIQFYKIGKRNPLTLARSRELLELYKKKRNTPGWRRELLLAPFLENLDETYEDKTRPWSLPWEVVKTAISKKRGTPGVQLGAGCPSLIPYLELVERAIQISIAAQGHYLGQPVQKDTSQPPHYCPSTLHDFAMDEERPMLPGEGMSAGWARGSISGALDSPDIQKPAIWPDATGAK